MERWLDLRLQEVLYYEALLDPDVACPIEAVSTGLSTNIFSLLVKREALWRKTLASTGSHPEQRQAALSHLQTRKVAVVIRQAWGGDRCCRGRKGLEIWSFFIGGERQPGDNKPWKWKACFLKQDRVSAETGLMRQLLVKMKLRKITHISFTGMNCSVVLYVYICTRVQLCNLYVRIGMSTIYHLYIYSIGIYLDTVVV